LRSLYDVNALIALLDRNHSAHNAVSAWFARNIEQGWASCPLTQNGCLRILSQPRYPRPVSLYEAFERLRAAASTQYHQFFPDDISILDGALVDVRRLSGYRQLTDVYLLALAVAHDARLVTLDTRILPGAVQGANGNHLVVI
jgi:toxin-antitoxin system PIN domain toxin